MTIAIVNKDVQCYFCKKILNQNPRKHNCLGRMRFKAILKQEQKEWRMRICQIRLNELCSSMYYPENI